MMRDFLAPVASTSILTLVSRLLGFLRDALMAHALGAGPAADAFVVAFRLPNLFRRLLAEGVLAQGLVPPLVQAASRAGPAAAARLLRRWLRHATAVGVLLLLAGPFLAPWVVDWLAPGFASGTGQDTAAVTVEGSSRALAAALLAAMWPYLAISGVTAVLAAGLNARGWFRAVACAPLMLNVALLGAFPLAPVDDPIGTARVLARAVTLGALLQVAWLALAAWRRHRAGGWSGTVAVAEEPVSDPDRGAGAGRLVVGVLQASVVQVNLLVATVVASTLVPGALSWLYFAERLVEFPLGIIAGGLGAVLLPRLASAQASGEPRLWCASVDLALESSWLILLPAAVGLSLLALPVVATLFQYGALSRGDALAAAAALAVFAPGVLPLGIARVLLPAAQTRVPPRRLLVAAGLLPLVHLALVLPLAATFAHVGIALAATLTALLQVATLLGLLAVEGYRPLAGRRLAALGRPAFASSVLAVLLVGLLPAAEQWLAAGPTGRAGLLLGSIALSVTAYTALLWLVGWRAGPLPLRGHHPAGGGPDPGR